MKKEKGITLLILIITVIVMLILVSAVVYYGTNSTKSVELQNFIFEMEQIQAQVDVNHEKINSGDTKYITLRKRF